MVALCSLVVHASLALAQPYPGGGQTPPTVKGEKFFRGGTARTGQDLMLFVLLALVALLVGVILYWVSRRRARSDV